jgi:hypothetical protein
MQPSSADGRRQFERNPVKARGFVHSCGRFQPATIVDYSQGGLRLEGTFGLFKGNPVEVELMSGIRVAGQVAWSLGGKTGIVFADALTATHPAIAELARKATNVPAASPTPMMADAP